MIERAALTAVPVQPAGTISDLITQLDNLSPQAGTIHQLSVGLPNNEVLSLLAANTHLQQCYWHDRNKAIEIGGLGCAIELTADDQAGLKQACKIIERINTNHELLWLGGFSFGVAASEASEQPYGYFRLPALAIIRQQDETRLTVNLVADKRFEQNRRLLKQQLRQMNWFGQCLHGTQFNRLFSVQHNLSHQQWQAKVRHALDSINTTRLDKVVLTRKSRVRTAREIPVHTLLKRWRQQRERGYGFMMQWQHQSFIGHSPERLFMRHGNTINTDALAGTVALNEIGSLDRLANDDKLIREHGVVSDYIEQALRPLSDKVVVGKTTAMRLRNIAHRHCAINAQLQSGVSTEQMIQQLHPTPAVGGYPKSDALAYLNINEAERGWYAGGVGVIGKRAGINYSDFCVAIRSATVCGNQMICQTGVGIVAGSEPGEEWDELDNKLASVLGALHGDEGP